MARVERISSTQPVAVEQAQLIDPSAFRFANFSAQELAIIGGTLEELTLRKRKADDSLAINTTSEARDLAKLQMQQFMLDNPDPDTWGEGIQKIIGKQQEIYNQQKFSAEVKADEDIEQEAFENELSAQTQIAITSQTIENDITVSGKNLINKISTDDGSPSDAADIDKQLKLYQEALERKFAPDVAVVQMEETLKEAQKLQVENLINDVHSAIEDASNPITGGNFETAKELAKNPLIPETKQTSLRGIIKTAETVRINSIKEQRQLLIDKTTSDTIREYFADDLTVATLNERHEKGLIKDSEFKSMMTGLTKEIPDNSNPFAAGRIRRAQVDFEQGVIKREEVDKIVLENYEQLDGTDRSTVVAKLEDIEAKIIATTKANAYSEGRGLMSQRFVGIQSEEDLIDLFRGAGLTEEEKSRINRRWQAEVNNRDLYERAVDDRFKEMRGENISDIDKFKAESLRILLEFQRRTQLKFTSIGFIPSELTLEEFEATVAARQQKILKKPAEATKIKPVSEMTTAEKQRELERIRELKRLAK